MKITLSRFAVTAMRFAVFTMAATLANAQPPKCDTQITKCGCTIGAPGNYEVVSDLNASQGLTLLSGCIDIEGKHVNLTVDHNIFGPGNSSDCDISSPDRQTFQAASPSNTGVGIHVLPSAANVAITVGEASICGWNYGVESETNNVNMYQLNTAGNNVGLLLNNATDNSCLTCASSYNGTGFQISGGSGNTINGAQSINNDQYGFWVDGSKHNMLTSNNGTANGLAGFYLGCSATANVKSQIPCTIVTATGNSLIGNDAYNNDKYGIAVERKSFYNNIEGSVTGGNTTKDIIDGNANCVYNNYQNDGYATKSPNCIQ